MTIRGFQAYSLSTFLSIPKNKKKNQKKGAFKLAPPPVKKNDTTQILSEIKHVFQHSKAHYLSSIIARHLFHPGVSGNKKKGFTVNAKFGAIQHG